MIEEGGEHIFEWSKIFKRRGGCQYQHYCRYGAHNEGARVYGPTVHSVPGY